MVEEGMNEKEKMSIGYCGKKWLNLVNLVLFSLRNVIF